MPLLEENLLTIDEAIEFVKSLNRIGCHRQSIQRWFFRGVHGVRLERVLVGGRAMTSREAVTRFFEASTLASDEKRRRSPQTLPRTPAKRRKASEVASRACEKAGF
jgi:hypothetical protein